MPNYTPNYNLKKPLQTENYNIDDANGNMDIIDINLKEIEVTVESQKAEIGTEVLSTTSQTLKGGINEIKSEVDLQKIELDKKAPLLSPTFTGLPKATANTDYTISQIRNAKFSTTIPTSLANGEICFVYE